MSLDLCQLPASAANAGADLPRDRQPPPSLRAEIIADKELQDRFEKDSPAYRLLEERINWDVARLTEHVVPAVRKVMNWSALFYGLAMLLGFGWWTLRLHASHSGWQRLTGTLAVLGGFAVLGGRTTVQTQGDPFPEIEPPGESEEAPDPAAPEAPTELSPRPAS